MNPEDLMKQEFMLNDIDFKTLVKIVMDLFKAFKEQGASDMVALELTKDITRTMFASAFIDMKSKEKNDDN